MKKHTRIVLYVFSILILTMFAVYLSICVYFNNRFFPGAQINGIDASGKTVEQVEEMIAAEVQDYTVVLKLREGKEEHIDGGLIDFSYVSDGAIQDLMDQQNALFWLNSYFSPNAYTMTAQTTYNEEMLRTAMDSLDCFQEANIVKPVDATIEETSEGYVVEPEVQGNELDAEKVYSLLKAAVDSGELQIDLEEEDCYLKPAVTSENGELVQKAEKLNKYFNQVITYNIGNTQEKLDYSTIRDWMTMDDDLNVEYNWNMVADWMAALGDKYDTFGENMQFTTTGGETITVKHENYGWKIDEASEVEELLTILKSGESVEREPIYLETARAYGENGNDIGDTYIEIDYTSQHMWFYKDGALLVDTPIVTGNTSKDMASPEGIFCVFNKEQQAVLKGEDYKTPVDYWMPFFDGVGVHDSKWRSEYGGNIYQSSGSHGCINTPWEAAKTIYENLSIGDPVICYSSKTSGVSSTQHIAQPAENRVLDEDGNDITDQTEATESTEGSAGDIPVVTID